MFAAVTFEIPALSAFLLIVAGILVGYAMSYPHRGQSSIRQGQIAKLKSENQELHQALRLQQDVVDNVTSLTEPSYSNDDETARELQAERERAAHAQAELDELRARLRSSAAQTAELQGELRELRSLQDKTETHGDQDSAERPSQQTIQSLTGRLHEAEETVRTVTQQLANERQQRAALDHALQEKESELLSHAQQSDAVTTLRLQLAENQARLEQTNARLQRTMAERDDAVQQSTEYTNIISELTVDRGNYQRALNTIERLRGDNEPKLALEKQRADDALDKLLQTEFLLNQQRQENQHLQRKLTTLTEEQDTSLEATARLRHAEQALNEQRHEYDELRLRFDSLQQEHESSLESIATYRQATIQLESDVNRVRVESDKLRSQREELLRDVRKLQQAAEETDHLKETSLQFAAVERQFEEAVAQLRDTEAHRDQAIADKQQLESLVSELREELQANRQLVTQARDARQERIQQLERELEAARQSVGDLRPTVAELQAQLAEQEQRVASSVAEQEFEMTTLCTQIKDLRQKSADQQLLVNELRESIVAKNEQLAVTEQERNEALAQLRRPQFRFDPASQAPQPTRTASRHSAQTRMDSRRGLIYTRPPVDKDDLKKISGVAERLEQRLNDFGVYRYEQIMNWNDQVVAEFGKLLAFKDRIERDDWVGQAAALHRQHRTDQQRIAS